MKKLRLSNIFHWLYAVLMFLPFILLVCNVVFCFGRFTPQQPDFSFEYCMDYINQTLQFSIPYTLFEDGLLSDVHNSIVEVFTFFTGNDTDGTIIENSVWALFVYWTEVSFLYVVFDVIMFPINLAHRWIDKGGIE